MIESLISSKTRIKLLVKFFLNPNTQGYLRGLAKEFGESSNAIRVELNRMEGAGLLYSATSGNKKTYQANHEHPLYNEIRSIVRKHLRLDQLVDRIIKRMGNLDKIYLSGDLALGRDSAVIDVLLIGEVRAEFLLKKITEIEDLIKKKIRFLHFSTEQDFENSPLRSEAIFVLLWSKPKYESDAK